MAIKDPRNDRQIKIVDTTLRDGEQTAGVVFANEEKIIIASMLRDLGVDQLEVGIPTMGGDEKEAIKSIVKRNRSSSNAKSIMAWNRAVIGDIEQSIDCDVDAVAISISVSDIHIKHKLRTSRQWVLENMIKSVEYAKKNGLYVSVNGEDASRADREFLVEFINAAKNAGADRFRYCDTVGIMEPFKLKDEISYLYNDFGMATANAIAGVMGGANHVGVTVNGLGERAGNAALEEVLMALIYVYGYKTNIDTRKFKEVSEYVSRASGRFLPKWKAIVGENTFVHESGIHADGAIKNPMNYEAYDPAVVGLERQIVIGKHSGKAAIVNKFKEYDIKLSDDEAKDILNLVRATTVRVKRNLFDKELVSLYKQYKEKEQ